MKLSFKARIIVVGLIFIAGWTYWLMAGMAFAKQMSDHKAAGFVISTLLANPLIAAKLSAQMSVILGLYAAFILLLICLGRRRINPRHRIEQDWSLLLVVSVSVCWLLLRIHSYYFPHSLWTWYLVPFQDPIAAWALDAICLSFVAWRVAVVITSIKIARLKTRFRFAISSVIIIVLTILGLEAFSGPAREAVEGNKRPRNVVIIGLDSLRRDVLLSASNENLPNLYGLRENSYLNSNVVTQIARTFPSWVTILTGLSPEASGARANHSPQSSIRTERSIAWDFKREGYRTIYATDETRFSHINHKFGFDKVIGPQMGITDFLLGQFNDQPLVNFFVQIPYAEYLLPALVGNRAFAHAYYPEKFIGRLERALGNGRDSRTFLSIHLCTAHWPFYVASAEGGDETLAPLDRSYEAMVRVLDQQLGMLMNMLRDSNYLDEDTLLVVLADHGEGLSKDREGSSIYWAGKPIPKRMSTVIGGHGTSLRTPAQWQVFAMFSGNAHYGAVQAGVSEALSSLEDVAPTIRRLSGVGKSNSSKHEKVGRADAEMANRNFVRIETGWRPRNFSAKNPQGSMALRIAETSYEIQSDGRMELRTAAYMDAVQNRDFGVTDGYRTIITSYWEKENIVGYLAGPGTQWKAFLVSDPKLNEVDKELLEAACQGEEFYERAPEWCIALAQAVPSVERNNSFSQSQQAPSSDK